MTPSARLSAPRSAARRCGRLSTAGPQLVYMPLAAASHARARPGLGRGCARGRDHRRELPGPRRAARGDLRRCRRRRGARVHLRRAARAIRPAGRPDRRGGGGDARRAEGGRRAAGGGGGGQRGAAGGALARLARLHLLLHEQRQLRGGGADVQRLGARVRARQRDAHGASRQPRWALFAHPLRAGRRAGRRGRCDHPGPPHAARAPPAAAGC